ncbi:two-partner secretion domain-containing protein [Peteryoungia algae]|uniref:YDG domain-containing protein n=1 Tax=Peteryoungia algae TaxID=2919917 RepID=A0ABT0CU62_9HYPH|nr:MBG domain-containing protein [Rhizobium sp. SSM4.3]MCJ8236705.1 YDG domain-containing protein [Rhizobium sp. SSM4.3]
MNSLYRHIWSKILGRVIVVAECVSGGGGKKSSRKRKLMSALMASTLLSNAAWADGLPTGGQVVAGRATIVSNGTAMTVNQSTDRMSANWQSFSIGAGNSVTFNQPGANSVALNRVTGQDPSQILGNLNANGQVFLLNPNGIAIGKTGSVQTGGFVASTLGMSNQDFLSGNYQFNGTGGAITNDGNLNGHVVALIAPTVRNNGTVTGDAALAAGTDVLLDFNGDGLLSVEVKANTMAGLVENNGLIRADGGAAILTAKGASQALAGVVKNTGMVEAKRIGRKNGRILLLGDMQNGEVKASGTLRAESVETSAAKVTIEADLKVDTQGGHWLIDPTDITIDAASAAAYQTALGTGNVTITTAGAGSDTGNITVNSSINWSSHILTLTADNNITINAALTSTGTTASDGLVLNYAQTTNAGDYTINAPVNLAAGSLFQTQHAADTAVTYTVITSLGAAGSTTSADLQGMGGTLSGNYVLGADIDASATSGWNGNAGFVPVGDATTNFTGKFDGLGHTVTGLTINRTTSYVGLFGYADGVTIRNIGMIGGDITGGANVGGLVGVNSGSGSTITNAYATGSVSGQSNVGGLVGYNYSNSTVTGSYATGAVSSTGAGNVGGLVGLNYKGTITNSYATGSVTGTGDYVGGLVGSNSFYSTVTGSYATGAVSGSTNVGGLVGYNYSSSMVTDSYSTGAVTGIGDYVGGLVGYNYSSSTVTGSYATGAVTGTGTGNNVGGLVGFNYTSSTVTDSYATGAVSSSTGANVGGLVGHNYSSTVTGSYATGAVSGSIHVGGLVGFNSVGSITDSFWDTQTTGQTSSAGGTGKTTAEMTTKSTFTDAGWNFSTIWGIKTSENSGYPILRALSPGMTFGTALTITLGDLTKIYGDANPALGSFTLSGCISCITGIDWDALVTAGTDVGTYAYSDSVLNYTWGSGFNASDYAISFVDNTGLIVTPRVLDLTGTRIYDGDTALANSVFTLGNLYNGQTLTLSGSGSMTTKHVGTGKALILSSLALGNGTGSASNYTLLGGTHTVDITAATISAITGLTASNKTYDGTTAATLSLNGAGFTDMIAGDVLTVATSAGAFDSENAGVGKTVNITGLTLGGTDAGNYTLSQNTATTTADIAKAGLTLTPNNASKTYGNALSFTGSEFTPVGLQNGETVGSVTLVSTGATSLADVGNYAITASSAIGGTFDINNYNVTYNTGTLTVNQAILTALAGAVNDASKTYDGLAFSGGNGVVFTGFVNGDDQDDLTGTLAYGGSSQGAVNAGSYAITASGLSSINYNINWTQGTLTVNPAALSVTAINASKTYDGLAFTGGNGVSYAGFVNGETASVLGGRLVYGGTAQNAVNAGSYTLTASGLTSGNYAITYVDGGLSVSAEIVSSCSPSGAGNSGVCGAVPAPNDPGWITDNDVRIEIVQTAQTDMSTAAANPTDSTDEQEETTPSQCRSDAAGEDGASQACQNETQTH